MIKLKVCGMKDPGNIREVSGLSPDYLGFIFYERSPRFVDKADLTVLQQLSPEIQKVGVFVNAEQHYVREIITAYGLDAVQLHGHESPEMCGFFQSQKVKVIKVFSVGRTFDFSVLDSYKPVTDFFLFDTKGEGYGGHGYPFDWELLKGYDNEKPFFLSGGLDLENVKAVKNMPDLNIHAIDVNSRFEIKPGYKDVLQLKQLKTLLEG